EVARDVEQAGAVEAEVRLRACERSVQRAAEGEGDGDGDAPVVGQELVGEDRDVGVVVDHGPRRGRRGLGLAHGGEVAVGVLQVARDVDEVGEFELDLAADGGAGGLVHALKAQIVDPDLAVLPGAGRRVDVNHETHPVDGAEV